MLLYSLIGTIANAPVMRLLLTALRCDSKRDRSLREWAARMGAAAADPGLGERLGGNTALRP